MYSQINQNALKVLFFPLLCRDGLMWFCSHKSIQGDVTVLLCVAPDVDALAGAQILTVRPADHPREPVSSHSQALFKVDFILYSLWPVANFDDIDRAREDMKAAPTKVSLLLLLLCFFSCSRF